MTEYGTIHKGILVLDFSPLSTMRGRAPAAWEGLWTGLNVHKIVCDRFATGERAFLFVRNADNELELWEIDETCLYDMGDTRIRIQSEIQSRGMIFQNRMMRKFLTGGQLYVEGISGTVDFSLKWRPDSYEGWFDWMSWQDCATTDQCFTTGTCAGLLNLKAQYRAPIQLPRPPETENLTNINLAPEFFLLQTRLLVTGPFRLGMATFSADELPERAFEYPGTECTALDVCEADPWNYSSEGA